MCGAVCLWLAMVCAAAPAGPPGPAGKVAYTRGRSLYVRETTAAGLPRPGSAPARVCRLRGDAEVSDLSWSADGRLLAYSRYLDPRDPTTEAEFTLWVVEARRGARPRRIAPGDDPAFGPRGHVLAYTWSPAGSERWSTSVRLVDLDTGRTRTLRAGAHEPQWTADGTKIALTDDSAREFAASVMLVDARDGRRVLWRRNEINVFAPLPSPNGRFVAYQPHLSRPKLQAVIDDRTTGRSLRVPHIGEPVLDWSPDGRWLLWTRWRIDPQNNGAYLWREVWATPTDAPNTRMIGEADNDDADFRDAAARASRKVGEGCEGRFAPDGRHVLYVCTGRQRRREGGDLCAAGLDGGPRRTLVRNVGEAIAVWRGPRGAR